MAALEVWIAKHHDTAVRIEVSIKKQGLGWFRLFRKVGGGKLELVDAGSDSGDGLSTFVFPITGAQVKEWTDPPPPPPERKKRLLLSFELRGLGAKAALAPVELSVLQSNAILEAQGAKGKILNANDKGGFDPVEVGTLTSAKALVIPFDIRFPKVS
jgi:hypothetical protein